MITKFSKNNSNKPNNEFYNLERIFEKFICDAIRKKGPNIHLTYGRFSSGQYILKGSYVKWIVGPFSRIASHIMNINLLETWRRSAKIKTSILGFSYNSYQNVVVRAFPMFSDWLHRLGPSLPNSVVAYKQHLFRNMASENSREAVGLRKAFSNVDIGRVRGFKPKGDSEI